MFQYTTIQGDQIKFSLFEKKISACNSFELIMFRNCTISLLGYGYTIHTIAFSILSPLQMKTICFP